jgi:hypothetical protein
MKAYQDLNLTESAAFQNLSDFVRAEATRAGAIEGGFEYERKLHGLVAAWEAELVGEQLKRYDVDTDEIEVGGKKYRKKDSWEEEYVSQAGAFRVNRAMYVPREGQGRAVSPMELRAGVVEGKWTPRAARLMAYAMAASTSREAEQLFSELGGMQPSASSLDRLPKRLSDVWEAQRTEFEDELRAHERVSGAAVTVSVSLDGVMVPMKDAGRVEKRSQEDKEPKGPAGYREVGCGTVTLYDAEGKRLETTRYARMPEKKKVTLKEELRAELASILEARPDLRLSLIADGAEDNWEFLAELASDFNVEDAELTLDLFHTLEHVKDALDAYHGKDTTGAKVAFEECRIMLREEQDGVERVIRALRYRRDRTRGSKRKQIEKEIKYLSKRKDMMRYADLLARNLPVGSGIVEAACKTLASERMKRSGMSWNQDGGQAVLTFRSLIQSDRWDRGWAFIAAQYRQDVLTAGSQKAAA